MQLRRACPADNLLEAGGPLPGIIRALSSLEDPRGVKEKFFDSSMEKPLQQEGAVVQQGKPLEQTGCTHVQSMGHRMCMLARSGAATLQWILCSRLVSSACDAGWAARVTQLISSRLCCLQRAALLWQCC